MTRLMSSASGGLLAGIITTYICYIIIKPYVDSNYYQTTHLTMTKQALPGDIVTATLKLI